MKSKHVTKNWKKVQDYDLMWNVCEQTSNSYKFIFFKIACISHTTTRPSNPTHQPINQCLPDVEITLHIVESCSFTWIHVIMFVCGPLVEAALDMRLPVVANPLKFALLWSIYTLLPPFMDVHACALGKKMTHQRWFLLKSSQCLHIPYA